MGCRTPPTRLQQPPGFPLRHLGFRVCRGFPIEPLATAPLDAGPLKPLINQMGFGRKTPFLGEDRSTRGGSIPCAKLSLQASLGCPLGTSADHSPIDEFALNDVAGDAPPFVALQCQFEDAAIDAREGESTRIT